MDLTKAIDCLPQEFTLAKLHVYGFDMENIKLLQDYPFNQTARVKLDST